MVITTVSRIINLILGMEKNHPLNFDWAPQNRNYKMNSYPHHFLSMLCECTISCEACMTGMEPNQQRSQIKSGIRVKIVLKQHQHSGILTEGIQGYPHQQLNSSPWNQGTTYRRQSRQSPINNEIMANMAEFRAKRLEPPSLCSVDH